MNIRQAHYQQIEKALNQAIIDNDLDATRAIDTRWDLLHNAKFTVKNNIHSYQCNGTAWIVDNLYPYLNDSHIDTALRHITKKIVRKFWTDRGY